MTPQEITAVADAVDAKLNRVIGALQTTLKDVTVPAIVAAVKASLPAGSVDVATLSDRVADEFSKRLAVNA